jgi:hypothetical protein
MGIYRRMILSAIALNCSQKEDGDIVRVDDKRRFCPLYHIHDPSFYNTTLSALILGIFSSHHLNSDCDTSSFKNMPPNQS